MSEERPPICPVCFKPKGKVDGAWTCFTRYQDCGIHNMEATERRILVESLLGNVLALLLDNNVYATYSKETFRAMLLKVAGDKRWQWP